MRTRLAGAMIGLAAATVLSLPGSPAQAATAAATCTSSLHVAKGGYAQAWCTGYRTGYVRAMSYCASNPSGPSGGAYYWGDWVGRQGQKSWANCPSNKYLIDGGYDLG